MKERVWNKKWVLVFHHISDPNSFPTALTLRKKSEAQDDKVKDAPAGIRSKFEAKLSKFSLKNTSEYKQKPPDAPVEVEGEKKHDCPKMGHQNVVPESLQAAEMVGWKKCEVWNYGDGCQQM